MELLNSTPMDLTPAADVEDGEGACSESEQAEAVWRHQRQKKERLEFLLFNDSLNDDKHGAKLNNQLG